MGTVFLIVILLQLYRKVHSEEVTDIDEKTESAADYSVFLKHFPVPE